MNAKRWGDFMNWNTTKWAVALFGHYKPRYELRENKLTTVLLSRGTNYQDIEQFEEAEIHKVVSRHVDLPTGFDEAELFVYNVTGWEKRAIPGDIIAFKPYGEDWTDLEKTHFLIVTIDGLDRSQMTAFCEAYYDLDSYEPYNPMTLEEWYAFMQNKYASIPKTLGLLEINKDKWYGEYIEGQKERSAYPRQHLKKRRFHVQMDDLESMGVETDRMLSKEEFYSPALSETTKLGCFDKMDMRYVNEEDGLNLIRPLTFEEV